MLVKIACVSVPILLAVFGIRKYLNKVWGSCKSNHSLRGKTFLITGANSGIGLETARALVARNARVIFACRNTNQAKFVVDQIRKEQKKGGEMIIMHLDLASLDSIRAFAEVVKTGFSKIDCLIDNAGVYFPLTSAEVTKDGFEAHMGVNHLGHFLLTQLLLELLEKAAPSRVVILSSTLHERGVVDFDDLNLRGCIEAVQRGDKQAIKKMGRHNPGYCNSKLMNVYFGKELAERTKDKGIDVFLVCPGFTYTNLFRYSIKWYHFFMMAPLFLFYMRSAKQGSQTVLHCATEAFLEGQSGAFFRNCAPYVPKMSFDPEVQTKLWQVSEKMIENGKPL